MQKNLFFLTLSAVLLPLCLTGCASTATSNTARTAREQMLLSDAVERSLSKVDFRPLAGRKVYIEEKYLECVDKPFVLGSVRHQVMRTGATIVDAVDGADVVMELRSGGVGTDTSESYLGTPEIALPGMLTVPEIRVAETKTQYGYAKLGMLLYDAQTREMLGDGGLAMAEANDRNRFVLGVGPFQDGSLKKSVEVARMPVAGMANRRLPYRVAFAAPSTAPVDPQVQFASESNPLP